MKVFQMNDCDWWMAATLDQARADYLSEIGNDAEMLDDPRELSETELKAMKFYPNDGNRTVFHSFAEELAMRVAAAFPSQLFATTEF